MNGESPAPGLPVWLAPSIDVKEGRDPLGLQTTTQDRLTPRLLPGILELSRRARYFSFHAYLLDRYRHLGLPADGNSLSAFLKAREWEFGLAVLKCPHNCGSIPVGANALRAMLSQHGEPPYPRGESVESSFGGYGLYYRSPLAELGIVARAGTQLGDAPIPIDVLYGHDRARRLVETFALAVAGTEYVQSWMLTTDDLPLDVLVEYARVACLCQLSAHPEERDAVHDALFGATPVGDTPDKATVAAEPPIESDDPEVGASPLLTGGDAVAQRRRSVAHFLTLIDHDSDVVTDNGKYREALWSSRDYRSLEHEFVAGQWAGLIAKDVWQDSLCSMWAEFCQNGVNASQATAEDGLTWSATRELAQSMVTGPPALAATTATADIVAAIADGTVRLPGIATPVPEASLETLRAATVKANNAISGLIVVLELHRRTHDRSDAGWLSTASVRSVWQSSVMEVMNGLTTHLATQPTVADTLWWFVERFVISVHERIAYSKLQQGEHTFRFRWEEGLVRFYNNGIGRFPLAAIRDEPLSYLTRDLALWSRTTADKAELTDRGRAFVVETLG